MADQKHNSSSCSAGTWEAALHTHRPSLMPISPSFARRHRIWVVFGVSVCKKAVSYPGLVSATAFVYPSVVLHIAYYRFMGIIVRGNAYSLSADITKKPDLIVLYGLVIAFIPSYLFYLPDIRV